MALLTPEETRERFRAFLDHARFSAEALSIRDKTGTPVPAVLSPAGMKLIRAIQKQEAAGRPVRIVNLKPRQAWVSTAVCAYLYKKVAYFPGQQCMAFGDLHKSAKNLFNYTHQFATGAKTYCGIKRPSIMRSHQDKRIEWDTGSWYEFQSADSTTTGRSYSIRHLHLSEYAFYRAAYELMTGLLQSVPDDPLTTIIVESTANGRGGPFYELWKRALNPREAGEWVAVFSGWHEHPEYRRLVDDPTLFQKTLTDSEHVLIQNHGLKFEQIAWRRWAIENKCERDERRFRQEYPLTAEEAFLTSGRPRFDTGSLDRQPTVEADAWMNGELVRVPVGTREMIQFRLRDDRLGALNVLKKPVAGEAYIIGADTAQGIDVGADSGTSNPDYSAAQVLHQATGEQVAVLHARVTPYEFAQLMFDLALYYNGAFIVPESTGIGAATIEGLIRQQYPPDRIYWREQSFTHRTRTRLEEFGYQTSSVSKPQLVAALERALYDGGVIVRHPATMDELRAYVYQAKGGTAASEGSHDDLVMALALACVGISAAARQVPASVRPATRPVDPEDARGTNTYRSWR